MRNKIFWGILIVLTLVIVGISTSPKKILNWVDKFPLTQDLVDRLYDNQYLPGPLRGSLEPLASQLARDGVIAFTNDQRTVAGEASLHMNEKLNRAAEAKVQDMFAKQYFEHESPDGKSPGDIIKAAGYDYIIVGENLALGNFKDDQALVDAWMNSPGHRANILNARFQEIGVAVGRGEYEGHTVWLAVQEFGTPLWACPSPSSGLKAQIDNNRAQIQTWQTQLDQMKAKLEQNNYKSRADYQRDLDAYNALVKQTNDLINETKALVSQYNDQVNTFNSCLDKNG